MTWLRRRHVGCGLLAVACFAGACEREVTVFPQVDLTGMGGSPSAPGGGGPVIEPWVPLGGSGVTTGGVPIAGSVDTGFTGGSLGGGVPNTGGALPSGGLMSPDLPVGEPGGKLEPTRILADGIPQLVRPAVNAAGVSLMTQARGGAAVLYVPFAGEPQLRHVGEGAADIYTAAGGPHHVALLRGASYRVFIDGAAPELSGSDGVYKEFLAASPMGCAWLDYGGAPGLPSGGGGLGRIIYRPYGADPVALTDDTRYRAELALSEAHLAFVEYASTDPGTYGQVVVVPLTGGPAVAASPSPNHQAAPAVHGDWVVWEEYVGAQDAVIRARHLGDGRVTDLSPRQGYRTRPDVRGDRVVWEDYSAGNGEIHLFDLGSAEVSAVVTGAGRSLAPRLVDDGLVWIEEKDGRASLNYARFAQPQ